MVQIWAARSSGAVLKSGTDDPSFVLVVVSFFPAEVSAGAFVGVPVGGLSGPIGMAGSPAIPYLCGPDLGRLASTKR